jgi:hypothetical protein
MFANDEPNPSSDLHALRGRLEIGDQAPVLPEKM